MPVMLMPFLITQNSCEGSRSLATSARPGGSSQCPHFGENDTKPGFSLSPATATYDAQGRTFNDAGIAATVIGGVALAGGAGLLVADFIQRRARDNAVVNVHVMAAMTRGLKGQDMTEIGLLKRAGAIAFTNGKSSVANTRVMAPTRAQWSRTCKPTPLASLNMPMAATLVTISSTWREPSRCTASSTELIVWRER